MLLRQAIDVTGRGMIRNYPLIHWSVRQPSSSPVEIRPIFPLNEHPLVTCNSYYNNGAMLTQCVYLLFSRKQLSLHKWHCCSLLIYFYVSLALASTLFKTQQMKFLKQFIPPNIVTPPPQKRLLSYLGYP